MRDHRHGRCWGTIHLPGGGLGRFPRITNQGGLCGQSGDHVGGTMMTGHCESMSRPKIGSVSNS
jgi:hypothetical protein